MFLLLLALLAFSGDYKYEILEWLISTSLLEYDVLFKF